MLDLSQVPGHRPRDLLPRPPHRRADLRRPGRQQLAPEGLRSARRLPGAAQDPGHGRRRRHDARPGDRRGQGLGPARPRRRGLPDRPEVELHAAQLPGPEVPGVQLRRRRARHLQGPRHPALQPAHRHRGHGHRRLRDGHRRRATTTSTARSSRSTSASRRRWKKRAPPASWATTSSAAASASSCTPSTASAPTSAAKKPRCSNRSKARRASRASSRRSRPASACTASRPRSTTPRPSPRCPGSSATAAQAYLECGKPNNGGTKIFSVVGDVDRPGNYEMPLGTPFAKLLELAGGVRGGRKLKAVIPGRLVGAGAAGATS